VVRDVVSWAAGLAGIAFQQVTHQVNVYLLAAYMTMIGFPGFAAALPAIRQWARERPGPPDDTKSEPSPSQSSSS
jgi:hypothetical protein